MRARVGRGIVVTLGVLLFAVGALWAFQGLGYIEGSAMTDVRIWAVIGPVVAGLGVSLVMVAFRPRA